MHWVLQSFILIFINIESKTHGSRPIASSSPDLEVSDITACNSENTGDQVDSSDASDLGRLRLDVRSFSNCIHHIL